MFDLQKKSSFYRMKLRNIDREVEPVFSTALLVACGFMAVILIGAGSPGSIAGGILFLAPLVIAGHAYWEDWRAASQTDDDRT